MPKGHIKSGNGSLYLFNIALDADDSALAANVDLVLSLKKFFYKVDVVTRFWDKKVLPNGIKVAVISGGSFICRLIGVYELIKVFLKIIFNKQEKYVLFHMNDKFAAILVPLLRMFKVKSCLWYSHAKASIALKWTNFFVYKVITTATNAYPLEHKRIFPIGQLVSTSSFYYEEAQELPTRNIRTIISVGRVAKSKFLEDLISQLNQNSGIDEVNIIGSVDPRGDNSYADFLKRLASNNGLRIRFNGPLKRRDLRDLYLRHSAIYSGTRKAIDKSAIEGALCGLFVISTNDELLDLTGMADVYQKFTGSRLPSISDQIKTINSFASEANYESLRLFVAHTTKLNCSLENGTKKLVDIITNQ